MGESADEPPVREPLAVVTNFYLDGFIFQLHQNIDFVASGMPGCIGQRFLDDSKNRGFDG